MSTRFCDRFYLRAAIAFLHKRAVGKTTPSSLRLTDDFKRMIGILMQVRRFHDRTAYFEQLLREDWEKQGGDAVLGKLLPPAPAPALSLNDAPATVEAPAKKPRRRGKYPAASPAGTGQTESSAPSASHNPKGTGSSRKPGQWQKG